jgi:peptidoglycan/xylan/chitin deacetylase (PgdA/CDA1 family)
VASATAGAVYVWFVRVETDTVIVQGVERRVPEGTTLVEAAERFGLRPDAGDLLDVDGEPLRVGALPGRVIVNGRRASGTTELREGDRIAVVDARDRREPEETIRLPVTSTGPLNPQFTLARAVGEQEIVRGRISRTVVRIAFHPRGPVRRPQAVALTFDDGPSRYTQKILAQLRRLRVRATFFVVGYLAERYPHLVRREVSAGMDVGNHSYSHPYRPPFDSLSYDEVREEIERGEETLSALGARVTTFRPPGGSVYGHVLEAAGVEGERIVLWSVDPRDWSPGSTAKQIVRNVLRAVQPGSIVLLHDGGGDRSETVNALPRIVKGIRKMGLRLVLVDGTR